MDVISKEAYTKLYQLLDQATPLKSDCGDLCQQVCCRTDTLGGIYLLPNEDSLFTKQEDWLIWEEQEVVKYDFPPSWQGKTYFVRCTKPCPRSLRPLQCRTFPLAPHLFTDGTLVLILETLELPYTCPLIARRLPLRQEFVVNTARVWHTLVQNRLVRDLVDWDSRDRENDPQVELTIVKVVSQKGFLP